MFKWSGVNKYSQAFLTFWFNVVQSIPPLQILRICKDRKPKNSSSGGFWKKEWLCCLTLSPYWPQNSFRGCGVIEWTVKLHSFYRDIRTHVRGNDKETVLWRVTVELHHGPMNKDCASKRWYPPITTCTHIPKLFQRFSRFPSVLTGAGGMIWPWGTILALLKWMAFCHWLKKLGFRFSYISLTLRVPLLVIYFSTGIFTQSGWDFLSPKGPNYFSWNWVPNFFRFFQWIPTKLMQLLHCLILLMLLNMNDQTY